MGWRQEVTAVIQVGDTQLRESHVLSRGVGMGSGAQEKGLAWLPSINKHVQFKCFSLIVYLKDLAKYTMDRKPSKKVSFFSLPSFLESSLLCTPPTILHFQSLILICIGSLI